VSWIGRIRDFFGGGKKAPSPPSPPGPYDWTPEPPPRPTGRGGGQRQSAWTADWRSVVPDAESRAFQRETGYSRAELIQGHLELFISMGGDSYEGQEQHEMFREYLDYMVTGHHTREEREAFYYEIGIDPRDIDWEVWRELMGYSRD